VRKLFFRLMAIGVLTICLTIYPVITFAGPDDEVRVALPWDPVTVNMFNMKTANELPVILHMHDALLTTMPVTGERVPNLAEPTVMKNKKDIKFTLEKGHAFHTGDTVTAQDVKFTYDQCMNPKNAMIMASALSEMTTRLLFGFMNLTRPGKSSCGLAYAQKSILKTRARKNSSTSLWGAVLSNLGKERSGNT